MDEFRSAYPPEEISPVALGLISEPPTLVLTYDLQKKHSRFGEMKKMSRRRKRKMPLRDFTDKSNVKRYAFNLRQRHVMYLAHVMDVTLEKMLRMIQEIQKGSDVDTALKIVNKEYSIDPEEDLNILAPAQLAQRKALMEETFRMNLVRPDDPGYVYDKVIHFDNLRPAGASGNDWDEDEEEGRSKHDNKEEEDEAEAHSEKGGGEDNTKSTSLQEHLSDKDKDNKAANESKNPEGEALEEIKEPDKEQEDELQELDNQFVPPDPAEVASISIPKIDPIISPVAVGHNDISSTSSDIEEALENIEIESGVLDEDEEFWQ